MIDFDYQDEMNRYDHDHAYNNDECLYWDRQDPCKSYIIVQAEGYGVYTTRTHSYVITFCIVII